MTRPVTSIMAPSDSALAPWPTLRSPSTRPSLAVAPLGMEISPILWKPLSGSQSLTVCGEPVFDGCLLYSLSVYLDVTHFSSNRPMSAVAYSRRARPIVTSSNYTGLFRKKSRLGSAKALSHASKVKRLPTWTELLDAGEPEPHCNCPNGDMSLLEFRVSLGEKWGWVPLGTRALPRD